MINNIEKKKYISTIFLYIISLAIILDCDSVYKWNFAIDDKVKIILLVTIAFATILWGILYNGKTIRVSKRRFGISIMIAIYFIIYEIIFIEQWQNLNLFILPLFSITFIYLFGGKNSIVELLRCFATLMIIISAVSLILFVFGSIANIIDSTGKFTIYVNNNPKSINSYFGIYFEPQVVEIFETVFARNCACFIEAPKFAVLLSIALFYELYLSRKNKKMPIIIISLTMLSTLSTAGIIYALLIVFYKNFFTKKIERNSLVKKIFSVAILIILVFSANFFGGAKMETSSYTARRDDYIAGFLAWNDNILFGNGYANTLAIRRYMSSFRKNNIGFSNSLFRILAYGGLYLGIIYIIIPVANTILAIKSKDKVNLALGITYFYLLLFISFAFNYICIPLLLLFIDNIFMQENTRTIT